MMCSFLCTYLVNCLLPILLEELMVNILSILGAPLLALTIKNLPAIQETWIQFLGGEDSLEKGMVTHSNILAWRILWTEKPNRLQSMGSQESNMTEQLILSLFSYIVFYSRILAYFSYSLYPVYFIHEFCSLLHPQCFQE